jgi:hypothetical protein
MLKKYPDWRIDVYKTHRTAAAPQWVYDNTFKNATRARLDGDAARGSYGGIPFPIPKSGAEVMWNHLLHWRGSSWQFNATLYQITADGRYVLSTDGVADQQMAIYQPDGSPESYEKSGLPYWQLRLLSVGPPIRAGEMITGGPRLEPGKDEAWVYLTGQRRVRKLPNACCDTPAPASAGVMTFDQTDVFTGRMDRFDWKIVGKKEMLIPYNENRQLGFSMKDVVVSNHVNPDASRWELHRVWEVEATLKAGQRHIQPKRRYYIDEDTWIAVLADHWDARGQLWQMGFSSPIVMPDIPASTSPQNFGFYDLISGAAFLGGLMNDQAEQYKIMPTYPDSTFTPEAMAGEGVR